MYSIQKNEIPATRRGCELLHPPAEKPRRYILSAAGPSRQEDGSLPREHEERLPWLLQDHAY